MKKTVLLTIALVCASFLQINAQGIRDEVFADPTRAAGLLAPYPGPQKAQTKAPRGYKPFYISHFGRHGSRWFTSQKPYTYCFATLSAADSAGALTPLGKDVLQRVTTLKEDADNRTGELTQLGFRQHKEIAGRMFKSFRRVFGGRKYIRANSTNSARVMLSMESFCQELLGRNPKLEIDMDASERDREFLASFSAEARKNSDKLTWKEDGVRLRDSLVHPSRLFGELFSDQDYVASHVDSTELMTRLFQLASIALDSDTGVRLDDLYTTEELFNLWQYHNYIYYAVWGPNPLAGEKVLESAALGTLKQIIERADEAIELRNCAADLRFSHDSFLVPLSTALQLDGCRAKVTDPSQVAAAWANFRISPMAGNIQMVFYANRKGRVLVKFMLNENEVGIPAVTDKYPYYSWKDVKDYYIAYYNL